MTRAGVILLIFTLSSAGCTSWRAAKSPPQQILSTKPKIEMRITIAGVPPVVLRRVTLVGDTLYGYSERKPKGIFSTPVSVAVVQTEYLVALPQDLIQKVEIRKGDAVKTTFLIIGIGVTVTAVLAAIALSDWSSGSGSSSSSSGGGDYMSCPLILCADHEGWHIDSGTYAGAIMPALARSDVDNLEHATERNGVVRLRLTGLSGEREHVDAISLILADHDPGVTIAPDARGNLHAIGNLVPPIRATDFSGRDALRRVKLDDEWCWESRLTTRDASSEDALRDGLEIEFPRPSGTKTARLIVDATHTPWAMQLTRAVVAMHGRETRKWYDDVARDSSRANRIRRTMARESFLHVSIWTGTRWVPQGAISNVGPECLKRQVVPLDLSGVEGAAVRARLECVPNLWLVDRVAIDYSAEPTFRVAEVPPETAVDLHGADVRGRLASRDALDYVIEPGDTAQVAFHVPPVPAGQRRTYLARTAGWYEIRAPRIGEPQIELLERLETQPGAIARFSVTRMNGALRALASEDWEKAQGE